MVLQSLNASRYPIAFAAPQASSLASTWSSHGPGKISELKTGFFIPSFESASKCAAFIATAIEQSENLAADWATQLRPWESLVEKGRALWGERWALYHLANLASGIKSSRETCAEYTDLFSNKQSLCRRARYTRLRAGVAPWWPKQLARASSAEERAFVVMLWATWGSPATLHHKGARFDAVIQTLSEDEWHRLYHSVDDVVRWTSTQSGARRLKFEIPKIPKSISTRTVALLKLRATPQSGVELFQKYLVGYKGDDLRILGAAQETAVRLLRKPAELDVILGTDFASLPKRRRVTALRVSGLCSPSAPRGDPNRRRYKNHASRRPIPFVSSCHRRVAVQGEHSEKTDPSRKDRGSRQLVRVNAVGVKEWGCIQTFNMYCENSCTIASGADRGQQLEVITHRTPGGGHVTASKSRACREGHTSGPCRWLFSEARTQIGFVGDT